MISRNRLIVLCICVASCESPATAPTSAIVTGEQPLASSSGALVNGGIKFLSGGTFDLQSTFAAISGTRVAYKTFDRTIPVSKNQMRVYDDVPQGIVAVAAPVGGLLDIDGANLIWIDADVLNVWEGPGGPDIHTLNSGAFGRPSIHGRYAAWEHGEQTPSGLRRDIELMDLAGHSTGLVTADDRLQMNPRVGDDYVVFEEYSGTMTNPEDADVRAYRISTGQTFTVAGGPGSQVQPDVEGNTVVYVEQRQGANKLFVTNLVTGTTRQIASAPGIVYPRISGSRVVWADSRSGDFDVYLYDLSSNTESAVVSLPGEQFLPDIDGDRIAYTDFRTGFFRVALFTIGGASSPPPFVGAVKTLRTNVALAVSAVVSPGASPVDYVSVIPRFNGEPQSEIRLSSQGNDMFGGAIAGIAPQDIIALDLVAHATSGSASQPLSLVVANNGGDRTLPCQSSAGADVPLDASGSTGPAGSLLYGWYVRNATALTYISDQVSLTTRLARGVTPLLLIVSDARGDVAIQTATVTVDDSCLLP